MHILHIFLRVAEIFFGSIAGLILSGLFVSGFRRFFNKSVLDFQFDQRKAQLRVSKESRWLRLAIAFDIFCNVLFLNGREDETISAHSWRAAQEGKAWGKAVCWWLNLFQEDHGQRAVAGDLERAEEIVGTEETALKDK